MHENYESIVLSVVGDDSYYELSRTKFRKISEPVARLASDRNHLEAVLKTSKGPYELRRCECRTVI